VRDSIEVIDRLLKRDLPQGRAGVATITMATGKRTMAAPSDGTGVGRCWPILTGERGHYELAAGRDPMPFIKSLEHFANQGGMISEQLWDADDLSAQHEAWFRNGRSHATLLVACRIRFTGAQPS